jgi:hypothetical protein
MSASSASSTTRQLAGLPRRTEVVLELEVAVEVVLEAALVAAGDDEDVVDAGRHGLLHHVLDGGLVDDRQHLLGLGLGGGQEAGAEAGRRDDGLPRSRQFLPPRPVAPHGNSTHAPSQG